MWTRDRLESMFRYEHLKDPLLYHTSYEFYKLAMAMHAGMPTPVDDVTGRMHSDMYVHLWNAKNCAVWQVADLQSRRADDKSSDA